MRWLIALLAALYGVGATVCGVTAQQVSRVPHVGVLLENSPGRAHAGDEFREGMRSLGWIEGSTISIEELFANGDPALLSANAAELAAAKNRRHCGHQHGSRGTRCHVDDTDRHDYGRRSRFGPRRQLGAAGR
jgi:hypothetical protein